MAAARELFTELEFTSLVKEFLEEGTAIGEADYREASRRASESPLLLRDRQRWRARRGLEWQAPPPPTTKMNRTPTNGAETALPYVAELAEGGAQMSLTAVDDPAAVQDFAAPARLERLAISVQAGTALVVPLGRRWAARQRSPTPASRRPCTTTNRPSTSCAVPQPGARAGIRAATIRRFTPIFSTRRIPRTRCRRSPCAA